jgi:hypothetical protein
MIMGNISQSHLTLETFISIHSFIFMEYLMGLMCGKGWLNGFRLGKAHSAGSKMTGCRADSNFWLFGCSENRAKGQKQIF